MKITGGEALGRQIEVPKNSKIRPTQDVVRKAVFSIIGEQLLKDAVVLDLFCGSGSFALEALSRGLKKAVFVDNQKICLMSVRKNLSIFNAQGNKDCLLIKADVFKTIAEFYKNSQKFNLIFADPPYNAGLIKKCLRGIDEHDILLSNAVLIIEHFKKEMLDIELKNLFLTDIRQYGDTKVSFFKKRI